MITLSLDGCKCTQHVINIKIVSVCTMINPKSMLWQLTIFSWATYNQFFFWLFSSTVELWIVFSSDSDNLRSACAPH